MPPLSSFRVPHCLRGIRRTSGFAAPASRAFATPPLAPLSAPQEQFLADFRRRLSAAGNEEDPAASLDEKYPVVATSGPSLRRQLRDQRPPMPPWLQKKVPGGENYGRIKAQLRDKKIATICQEGRCPNIGECWGGGEENVATATVMLLGDTCTRACRFCSVKTSRTPPPPNPKEPEDTAEAIAGWGVDYIVLTMVDRDDLADGGSEHVAQTIRALKAKTSGRMLVECLSGDYAGNRESIARVARSGLDVYAHNIETVERLTPQVRDRRATYRQSIWTLEYAKTVVPTLVTKSSIMLGVGETDQDVRQAMADLRAAGVDCLTLGQYLQPDRQRMKVTRYVPPEEFDAWRVEGEGLGFRYVASGPFVRSSYRAGEFYIKNIVNAAKGAPSPAAAT